MKSNYPKKFSIILVAVIVVTTGFFFGSSIKSQRPIAEASFLDVIRALVTINPLAVEVAAPAETMVDGVFRVQAKIINRGEEKIDESQAEIFIPQGLVLVAKNKVQKAGAIPAQKYRRVQWRVRGEKTGNYVIVVSAKGELRGYAVEAEASTIITIIEEVGRVDKEGSDARPSWRSFWQNLLNFFKIG